jgi:hypothetical protein
VTVRFVAVTALIAALMVGCTPSTDEIKEIEVGVNGVKVETRDDQEYYFRHGVEERCEEGERLWDCADHEELLTELRQWPTVGTPTTSR